MRWGVLGPLSVTDDAGTGIRVPAGRLQTLLAVLLMRANQPVPLDEIIDIMWDGTPPAAAARTVRVYLARLRQVLGPNAAVRVQTRSHGYLCQVDEDEFDLLRFQTLYRQARTASQERSWSRAADLLADALGQWRGAPLADIPSELLRARECPRLENLRQQAIEDTIDARMNLHQHGQLIPQLRDLTHDQPLREHLHAQLMRALARSGRRAEALDAYRHAHRALSDQLGIQPGPELRDLHQRILTSTEEQPAPDDEPGQPAAEAGHIARPTVASEFVVPHQLPAPPGHFTGRQTELDTLVDLLASADAADATVVISAIEGMAGIGKTALAVHAAHQLADQFADGVLFADLHGFTPDTEPTPPEQALDRLLRGLGLPGPQIPPDLEARVGLYRSVLAGRRVLIVLDNAADEAQLTPLLPATAGCAAIVTSRRHLAGLDDATHLPLPVLGSGDATDLFCGLACDRATPTDQAIVERIVALCGHLPLAIRITAARLRLAPATTLSTVCAELADALETGSGLEWLSDGHRAISAALAVSYRQLTTDQQHALWLTALHPGPEIEPFAMAALADTTVHKASELLDQLHAASLLNQPTHRRYTLHALVAAYAATPAADLHESDRHAALDRLYNHYATTSSHAVDLTRPWEADQRPRPPAAATPMPSLHDQDRAQTWLDTETDNLLAAADHATVQQRVDHTLHQSATLGRYLRFRGHNSRAALLHHQALQHARATGNRNAEEDALVSLGYVQYVQGQYRAATHCLEQALQSARHTGNSNTQQDALIALGYVHYAQGRYGPATDCFERTLQSTRHNGNSNTQQDALRGLGAVHYQQGHYRSAADCFERALQGARHTGNSNTQQDALIGLGYVHYAQGRYGPAAKCFEQGLESARHTGNINAQQDALNGLGAVHRVRGQYAPAAKCFEQGLASARHTGNINAQHIALRGLGVIHFLQGGYGLAAGYFEHALTSARQTADRNEQFEAHHGLGRVHYATHNHQDALRHHQTALQLALDIDQPPDQARAHDGLAHAYQALNNPDEARRHWQVALDLLTNIGTDHTEEPEVTAAAIHVHLHDLTSSVDLETSEQR